MPIDQPETERAGDRRSLNKLDSDGIAKPVRR
jgi:hypothetical protein